MLCRVALALSTTRGRAPIPTPKRPSIGDWPDDRMPDKPLGPPVYGQARRQMVSTDDGENIAARIRRWWFSPCRRHLRRRDENVFLASCAHGLDRTIRRPGRVASTEGVEAAHGNVSNHERNITMKILAFVSALALGMSFRAPPSRSTRRPPTNPTPPPRRKGRPSAPSVADAKGLHGKKRREYREECKKGKEDKDIKDVK